MNLNTYISHFELLAFVFSNNAYFSLGVGTRDYYRKLGYELDGPYMSKTLL